MAIYHLEAKVISRGAGRSAVAAAAYMSCSQILNDYDGVQHDYTRKQGLVWQQIFLPEYAPAEWSDRGTLWNAVEENEKTKDSRLAREFVVALPIEMGKAEWQNLLTVFIKDNFVADGMCADVCIHDTDGHNPHAHIMVTVRPLAENGQWQYKTEKEYLCVRDGEEMGFTGAEFKQAQKEGWEKQYQYKVGRKKEYMAPSAAEAAGYERASKTPKSTRFGRQNPIAARCELNRQIKADNKLLRELTGEAESMDKAELHAYRQILRKTNTQNARDRLQQAHGKQYSAITMMEAQQDVDHLLREDERKLEPPVQKWPIRHQPEPVKSNPSGTMKDKEARNKSARAVSERF